MAAPVNVKLRNPTISVSGWSAQAKTWRDLNTAAGGVPGFYPLTIKAAYVIGIEYHLCQSVSVLLSHTNAESTTYIPAFGVFASGIELLGRCIRGNDGTKGSVEDLKTGFKWLVDSSYATVDATDVLVTTPSGNRYTIEMLAALRHYAAHGQATSHLTPAGTYKFGTIDIGMLGEMPAHLAEGLERYWQQLQSQEDLCNSLALANVIALRNWPVHTSWRIFDRDSSGSHHSVTEIFSEFDWHLP